MRRVLLLPSAVSRVAPRKKALLYLNFPGPGEPEDVVGLQEAVSIKNGRLMWVIPRHCDVTLRELLAGKTTLKELARQKKKPPEARIQLRHRAEEFAFSQEIVLRYIFLENHHGKAAARAYYCASTHGQPGRKTKGKCLSDRIEKGLRGDNRQEVLARLALNNPGLGDIIVRDIRSAYREELEELTLKTVWFCCRKDLQLRSSYDDEMARTLFCGPKPMLANLRPGEALERDYLAAMEQVLGEPQIRHWQQLDLILDEAQQAGYLRRNRVHEMMSSLSRQLSQEAQNVRSNLAKKTFSWQEEERILAYFQEKTSVYVKKHRASRYEAEPLVLAAAIRFFTGMSAAEVCALRWSDLDRIRFPEEELYQLRVERYAREDGSVCSHAARDDWRRYRLIPVVPELVQMMEGRRLFLARQRDEDPKLLSGRYMFPRRGRPGDQPAPCRPQDIRNQCSKVLSRVNIAPLKLDLPEEKGRVEIDLNRYYGDQFRANFRLRASDTCGLTGGELASLVVADSVLRLKPGVLAEQKGYEEESYWDGLLESPQYTRPEVWEGRAVPDVMLGGDHQKIDAWRGEKSRERTRLRRPELYEQWCESHPITELPKWKRGENVRLVKTEEQFAAAAKLFAEGRRAVCAGNWTEEYCASLTEEEFLAQLKAEKKGGWACYLYTTKDVPDGMVSVDHKTGRIEHLFVSGNAQGKGIGQKMLDFARKKLEEYEHPRLSVLDTNARAIALYRRMGWKFTGEKDMEFDPAEYPSVVKKCALLWMQYEG